MDVERKFQANQYYYELVDGVVWNPPNVVFRSRKSAVLFQKRYPEFTVRYMERENGLSYNKV